MRTGLHVDFVCASTSNPQSIQELASGLPRLLGVEQAPASRPRRSRCREREAVGRGGLERGYLWSPAASRRGFRAGHLSYHDSSGLSSSLPSPLPRPPPSSSGSVAAASDSALHTHARLAPRTRRTRSMNFSSRSTSIPVHSRPMISQKAASHGATAASGKHVDQPRQLGAEVLLRDRPVAHPEAVVEPLPELQVVETCQARGGRRGGEECAQTLEGEVRVLRSGLYKDVLVGGVE